MIVSHLRVKLEKLRLLEWLSGQAWWKLSKNTQQRVLPASIIIIHQQTNLVFRVLRLLGQRVVAGRDYGVVKKKRFFFSYLTVYSKFRSCLLLPPNTANSSQRSKHHSILHRRHVGFCDMSTSGLSGIHFCPAAQKYCLKSTGLFFQFLSKFKVFNYHIIW